MNILDTPALMFIWSQYILLVCLYLSLCVSGFCEYFGHTSIDVYIEPVYTLYVYLFAVSGFCKYFGHTSIDVYMRPCSVLLSVLIYLSFYCFWVLWVFSTLKPVLMQIWRQLLYNLLCLSLCCFRVLWVFWTRQHWCIYETSILQYISVFISIMLHF